MLKKISFMTIILISLGVQADAIDECDKNPTEICYKKALGELKIKADKFIDNYCRKKIERSVYEILSKEGALAFAECRLNAYLEMAPCADKTDDKSQDDRPSKPYKYDPKFSPKAVD